MNKKEIIKGLVGSLIILIIPVVGYSIGTTKKDIWTITAVVQACFTLLWIISFSGEYSRFAKGFKLIWKGMRSSKKNKLGTSEQVEEKKRNQNKKEEKKKINWQGVWVMSGFAVVEILLALITAFN